MEKRRNGGGNQNQLASSPTKRLPSELAEAITGSVGWKLTSLTEPEWPGRAYSSPAVFESQTYAVPGWSDFFFFEGKRERRMSSSNVFSPQTERKTHRKTTELSPSDEPAATRAPPSSLDQQHRSRLRSSECAAPTNAREHRSAGANGRTSQQRSVPSLELESRCVGAAAELAEPPGLSASEVTVSEWPTSVRDGVEVLRRSLFWGRG